MSTIRLDFESVETIEGERRLMVIAWDVATNRPAHANTLAAMAMWLDQHGYNYITGTNGRWSNEIGPDPRRT